MSSFYYNPSHHAAMSTMPSVSAHHNQHTSRSRRGARFSASHHPAKPFKPSRATREAAEVAHTVAFRKDFEAARSFDLDDDEVFCPWHLLTDDDVRHSVALDETFLRGFEHINTDDAHHQLQSIHSSSSDRSSSSSGSPVSSPPQHQLQPAHNFTMPTQAQPHLPSIHHGNAGHLKIHQPMAQRQRNAIPIVDPNSRNTSPPTSISPARQAQKHYNNRRW